MRTFLRQFLTAIALLPVAFASLPSVSHADTCVVDGTILSLSEECLNDITALIVDSSKVDANGWQYAFDHTSDGSGAEFNIFGLALKLTQNEVIFVVNGDLPIEGFHYVSPNVPDSTVGWGDLFFDSSGSGTFQNASALKKLLAIHFVPDGVPSDSGAPGVGLFDSVEAKTVVGVNAGYASLQDYENFEQSFGVTPNMADLPFNQTYYVKSSALNSILNGNFLGGITYLTGPELTAAGYDSSKFAGLHTIAFKITKNLMCDVCGVFQGDGTSCLDCNGVPNGGAVYDQCEVCGGDGTSCLDCAGIPNGQTQVDQCGVCGGDGTSCLDCNGSLSGNQVLDQCGVCGGDGTSCLDCSGIPHGEKIIDQCGVCGGNGTSCLDCKGVPNGTTKIDSCGVCGGDGQSCISCKGTDISASLFALDGTALKLKNNVHNILRLYSTYKVKSASASAAKKRFTSEAEDLYGIAWTRTWSLPKINQQFVGPSQGVSTSNVPMIQAYNDSILDLYNLNVRALKRVRRDIGNKNAGSSLLTRAGKLKKDALATSSSIPSGSEKCPVS